MERLRIFRAIYELLPDVLSNYEVGTDEYKTTKDFMQMIFTEINKKENENERK